MQLGLGLAVFVGLMTWQVRAIEDSSNPALRALEGLFLAVPLFLLLFASTYFLMSRSDPSTFTSALSRTDALYFTVTIFSTVGFGDISAQTETARLVVTGQMMLDLVILGVGVRIILGAVERGRDRLADDPERTMSVVAQPLTPPVARGWGSVFGVVAEGHVRRRPSDIVRVVVAAAVVALAAVGATDVTPIEAAAFDVFASLPGGLEPVWEVLYVLAPIVGGGAARHRPCGAPTSPAGDAARRGRRGGARGRRPVRRRWTCPRRCPTRRGRSTAAPPTSRWC